MALNAFYSQASNQCFEHSFHDWQTKLNINSIALLFFILFYSITSWFIWTNHKLLEFRVNVFYSARDKAMMSYSLNLLYFARKSNLMLNIQPFSFDGNSFSLMDYSHSSKRVLKCEWFSNDTCVSLQHNQKQENNNNAEKKMKWTKYDFLVVSNACANVLFEIDCFADGFTLSIPSRSADLILLHHWNLHSFDVR